MQQTIGIIGNGFVGKAVAHGFKTIGFEVHSYDKYQSLESFDRVVNNSSIIFLCLPTPFMGDRIDLSILDEVMADLAHHTAITKKIVVIKSTVIPGTTDTYHRKYPHLTLAFNPEFLTEANYLQDFLHADRTVIGAYDEHAKKILSKLYSSAFPDSPVINTDPTTAELSKYMANTFLATKVIFANELFDMARQINADYEKTIEIVTADRRIGKSHFGVTTERGFGGKCFPKDIIALLGLFDDLGVDASLLKAVWYKNLRIRKDHDWNRIPFVNTTPP